MKTSQLSLVLIFLVGLDQVSKMWISSQLNVGESLNLLPVLSFTLVHNTGIAFSIFNDGGAIARWVLVFIISSLLVYLFFLLVKKTSKHKLELSSLVLIVSGGLGNLMDRVFLGYVVDFIHLFYKDYSFYVFNLADSYITVGIMIYLTYFFFIERTNDA